MLAQLLAMLHSSFIGDVVDLAACTGALIHEIPYHPQFRQIATEKEETFIQQGRLLVPRAKWVQSDFTDPTQLTHLVTDNSKTFATAITNTPYTLAFITLALHVN